MEEVHVTCYIIEGLDGTCRHGTCLDIGEARRWVWGLWGGTGVAR